MEIETSTTWGTEGEAEDIEDILTDQDQTSPRPLKEREFPTEFSRGHIDVKTQMDRLSRIAKAQATHHYDLDDSPETTPGGLEEVMAKIDREFRRLPRRPDDELLDEDELADRAALFDEDRPRP